MSTLIAVMRGLLPLTMLATVGLMMPGSTQAQPSSPPPYQCIMPLPVEHSVENAQPTPVQQRNICRLPARRRHCIPLVNQVEQGPTIENNIDESTRVNVVNNVTSNPMVQQINDEPVIEQTDDIRRMINVIDLSPQLHNTINFIANEPVIIDEPHAIEQPLVVELPLVVEQPLPDNLLARRTASDDAAVASMRLTNYPNPFTARTTIDYTLAREGHTSLMIYDATGNLVTTLVDGRLGAGSYSAVWTPEDLPSGTYVCRLQCDGSISTRTVVLNR